MHRESSPIFFFCFATYTESLKYIETNDIMMKTKSAVIREDQIMWLDENSINFSKLVRNMLDVKMEEADD